MGMFQKISLGFIITLMLIIGYYAIIKVPNLQDEINSFTYLEPDVVYLPGRIDTVTVIDTVWRSATPINIPDITGKTDTATLYETAIEDSLIKGRIFSEVGLNGTLHSTWLDYRFKDPIISTVRVDTVFVTQTIERRVEVPMPRNRRLQIGGFVSNGDLIGTGLGPKIQFLSKNDNAFSYSYDALNEIHLVGFTRTIRLK